MCVCVGVGWNVVGKGGEGVAGAVSGFCSCITNARVRHKSLPPVKVRRTFPQPCLMMAFEK